MKHKTIASELRDVDEKEGVVDMYWSSFGNRDSDGDIIRRGSYANTIREWGPMGSGRVKFLWQHDPTAPIGKPLELTEDSRGLRAVVKIAPTRLGKDALVLYAHKVITEHSVGIDVISRDDRDRSVITETRLYEGSAVTWGANAETPVMGVKAPSPSAIRKALSCNLSDETASVLESRLELDEVWDTITELNAAFRRMEAERQIRELGEALRQHYS